MPTKFSEFFTLAANATDFQTNIFNAIKDATSIVGCYFKTYDYIVSGLKWSSMTDRHDLMDDTVDISARNQAQMDDARQYFESGELAERGSKVLFEYLDMVPQDPSRYGANVFNLVFKTAFTDAAKHAIRQVRLYSQVQIYNDEYDTQLAWHQANPLTTTQPPNGKLAIDPAVQSERVNPDDPNQWSHLTKFVDELVQWIRDNYPVLKAVRATPDDGLFPLVFDQAHLSFEDKIGALDTMLDKIRSLGKKNAATRKAFGTRVIGRLEGKSTFWNQPGKSKAYAKILEYKPAFNKNATRTLEIYDYFKTLFTDFLNPNAYPAEPNPDDRRSTALAEIKTIFEGFKPTPARVANNYTATMKRALAQIKDDYEQLYTNNLLRARRAIPAPSAINPILPADIAFALKDRADECLSTLPLLLIADKREVRFFTIPNYVDLKALNDKSVDVLKINQTWSSVVVRPDPDENDEELPRPIYRGIRFSSKVDEYIAFCNLPHLVDGTFYYRHFKDPAIIKIAATNAPARDLTIDFQNYTINYPGKVNGPTKDDAGELYREGASTARFYQDLKNDTKWETISAVRRYDPYYTTNPADATKPEPHLTGYVAAGRGATRALPLGDQRLCLWWWNRTGLDFYRKLGAILGLPITREVFAPGGVQQLQAVDTASTVQIAGTQCDFVNYGPLRFSHNKFYYQIIGITPPGGVQEFYVRVNTPIQGVAANLTKHKTSSAGRAGRPMEQVPGLILSLFDFSYYRRITSFTDEDGDIDFSDESKVIQRFKKGDKRKPRGSVDVPEWSNDDYDAVGVNLPICFNIPENIVRYYLDKQKRGKMINKGNALYREQKPRKDAGTAMKPIYPLLKRPFSNAVTASKVPATAFANGSMARSLSTRGDWGKLKLDSSNHVRVNQEWCHLRGHGDGGEEYPGNFVSGSIHCNTEQLAVETGQRLVTQQMPERSFVLHTTAYLLRDAKDYKSTVDAERASEILDTNYLDNEQTYRAMLHSNTARRSRELGIVTDNTSKKAKIEKPPEPKPKQGDVAPLAAYIRYKVMRSEEVQPVADTTKAPDSKKRDRSEPEERRTKYFDFIFEGQSEFIDLHQFTIISQAVRFALAGLDSFKTWYTNEKALMEAKALK